VCVLGGEQKAGYSADVKARWPLCLKGLNHSIQVISLIITSVGL